MRKIKTLLLTVSIVILLTGCSSEQIAYGSWKENLQNTTKTDTEADTEADAEQNSEAILKPLETTDTAEGILAFFKQTWELISDSELISTIIEMDNAAINKALKDINEKKQAADESGLIKVELLRVVDGDTLLVNYKDEVYIRLIGINTPESVHPEEEKNTSEGILASNYTKELLANTDYVWLEFDTNMYDPYDRILAYVWLSNDTTDVNNMLNTKLLQSGTAQLMTSEPNTKYARELENAAK